MFGKTWPLWILPGDKSLRSGHGLMSKCTGRRSLHIQNHDCASCGYPRAKTRSCTVPPPLFPLLQFLNPSGSSPLTWNTLSNYGLGSQWKYTTSLERKKAHPRNPKELFSRLTQTFSISTDNWGMKAKRRKTVGTGRMRSLKEVPRHFKNGFRVGTPKGARGAATAAAS